MRLILLCVCVCVYIFMIVIALPVVIWLGNTNEQRSTTVNILYGCISFAECSEIIQVLVYLLWGGDHSIYLLGLCNCCCILKLFDAMSGIWFNVYLMETNIHPDGNQHLKKCFMLKNHFKIGFNFRIYGYRYMIWLNEQTLVHFHLFNPFPSKVQCEMFDSALQLPILHLNLDFLNRRYLDSKFSPYMAEQALSHLEALTNKGSEKALNITNVYNRARNIIWTKMWHNS